MRFQVRLTETHVEPGTFRAHTFKPGTLLDADEVPLRSQGGIVTCYTDKGKRLLIPRYQLWVVKRPEPTEVGATACTGPTATA
jgi:hypothetical protein